MGFSEREYPTLPNVVSSCLKTNDVTKMSKSDQDDVVSLVVDELLTMPPSTPKASGSGLSTD